jgi:transketolase
MDDSNMHETNASLQHVEVLMARMTGDEKHDAAATSTLHALWVLYDVLRIEPGQVGRDRLYLSRGHGPMAYYAILAARGLIPESWLQDWCSFDSPLGLHPDRNLVSAVEISSGSLGHGLPLAVGSAIGLRAQRHCSRVVVLVGDGELDEGSNHEALELAAALGLGNLSVIVVDNSSASYGGQGQIAARFATEGWQVAAVNGRSLPQLRAALTARAEMPNVVIARIGDQ